MAGDGQAVSQAGTILILGGTAEAAALAGRLLAGRPGCRIVTSLAGRTSNPKALPGEIRVGGFGGADGLATWIRDNQVSTLIDATHPFAEAISANAAAAAEATGVACYVLRRPAWQPSAEDRWIDVPHLEAAVAAIPAGATAFLALGKQHVSAFAARTDCRFVLRMVEPPKAALAFDAEIVLGRPAENPDVEAALFQRYGIDCLVCRNSGGSAGYAKIVAARQLGLPVVMIARPPARGEAFDTVEALLAALR